MMSASCFLLSLFLLRTAYVKIGAAAALLDTRVSNTSHANYTASMAALTLSIWMVKKGLWFETHATLQKMSLL